MQPGEIRKTHPNLFKARAYAGSVAAVAITLLAGFFLKHFIAISTIALMLLIAVQIVAIAYGLWPALAACIISALGYNFLFIPPLYTFTVADPENLAALFFFTVAALITSNLTSRLRAQALIAQSRARTTEDLYRFSSKLAGVVALDGLLWATAYQIAMMLKLRVVILLPVGKTAAVRAGYPPEDNLSEDDLAAANLVLQHGREAGRGSGILPNAKRLFLPLRTGRGVVGVVGLDSDRSGPLLDPEQRRLYEALADQTALALERINLAEDVERVRIEAETEKFRSALLTSISHDLRTPLASILGSATSLKGYRANLDETAQQQLIDTIEEEAQRLNRFISDLLDMTRLEAGAIALRMELIDIADIAGSALRRAGTILAGHKLATDLSPGLPMLRLDPVLFEQVLFNLLDNAAKYAPPGTTISLLASHTNSSITVRVLDEGEGILPAELERVFDKFYRIRAGDRQRAGTGLGLAICRGFVEAMGGTIFAANRNDRSGAAFIIELPIPAHTHHPEERVE